MDEAINPKSSDYFDVFTFWLVNLSSAFMLSAAHNVLFFVLDIHTIILHFLHFVFTFLFLIGKIGLTKGFSGRKSLIKLAFRSLYPVIISQIFLTSLSAYVHSQNRSGELIFDFLATIMALKFDTKLENVSDKKDSRIWDLLIPVAFSGSLSWLEFGHIEYDSWTLLLSPVLAVVQGLQFVLVRKTFQDFRKVYLTEFSREKSENNTDLFEEYLLCFSGFITMLLLAPALISYTFTKVPFDASWESIDFVSYKNNFLFTFKALIGMSFIFMISFKYSELWLQTHLELHHFCALEHTKYFLASCGQWFLQNMAHATIYGNFIIFKVYFFKPPAAKSCS